MLGLAYSVIAPFIMPLCMLFFMLAFVVYCWLFTHVYTPAFDCHGGCWYEMFDTVMLGLFLSILSLAGLASAFVGFDSHEFSILLLLSCLVIASYAYFYKTYYVSSKFTSLEDACDFDLNCDAEVLAS